MMNKKRIFCFFAGFLFCWFCRAQTPLQDYYYQELLGKDIIQPVAYCFLVSSPTGGVTMELLFGSCANVSAGEVNTTLPPGTVDGSNPVDFYFRHQTEARDVFFKENRQPAEWLLVLSTPCTLDFTLLGGTAPQTGALEFFQAAQKLGNIVAGSAFQLASPGEYVIRFTPPPEKSDTPAEVTYSFQPGWNLLHLPIAVYADQRREGDRWQDLTGLPRLTLSGRTYVSGGEIRCGEAFWVFYTDGYFANNMLTVLGYQPLPAEWPARQSGWNFQGKQSDNTADRIFLWGNRRYQPVSSADLRSDQGSWLHR